MVSAAIEPGSVARNLDGGHTNGYDTVTAEQGSASSSLLANLPTIVLRNPMPILNGRKSVSYEYCFKHDREETFMYCNNNAYAMMLIEQAPAVCSQIRVCDDNDVAPKARCSD